MRKALKLIWNIITSLIVVAVVALAVMLAGVRFIGLSPYAVLSGSMRPTYEVGSLIYVEKADYTQIRPGDIITFVMGDDLTVATHRVVSVSEDGEYFFTKGDANEAEDGAPVYYKNIVGKPVFTIPLLGYVSSYIQTRQGIAVCAAAAAVFLLLAFVPDMIGKSHKKKLDAYKKI